MDFIFTKREHKGRLYVRYTILFIVIAICMFGAYTITGHTFILGKDALNQHLPLMIKYREMVRHFLAHPGGPHQWWSWQMGLGSDTFQVFSYYTIGDVFAYLALLFPVSKMTLAYQVIIVLRMYCVGLAFVYFAQHFNFREYVILAGSLVYLVNSYLLYAAVAQPFFLTTFILFPLIVVQIERVLQGGSSWPLLGAFLWMLVSNYYFAFVLGIGSIIYLVLRVATHYRHGLAWGKVLAKLAFASFSAILLAAVLLLPEILGTMNSTRVGSVFASGLKVYPLYYYLFLPKQLINGGQWYFMYWSALGIVSIGFIALVYLYMRPKKYPLLSISLALSLVMLLIPAVGAFFNGMMSASNRWTLLIYLPLAMTVCLLIQHASELSHHELWVMTTTTGIYLAVLLATYFFQNDPAMFMPLIFLITSMMCLWLINLHGTTHADQWLLGIVLLNAAFNAIYAALPYNGGFSEQTLSKGEYQTMVKNRYGGLDADLSNKTFYRVSTISNNKIVAKYNWDNDLTSGLHNIDSYYSIQNKYLGDFNNSLQNLQYTPNIPIRQTDDRTVLNNFYGVKYLFVQSNGLNAKKIPAGYRQDKLTDPIVDYDHGQSSSIKSAKDFVPTQTIRYKTKQNFPLLYWQDSYIKASDYAKLNPTAKERALASGVVVAGSQKPTKGMKTADLSGNVKTIPTELISNRLNKVNPAKLKYVDSEESYRWYFPSLQTKAQREALAGSELHFDFSTIHFTPFTMKEQLKYEQAHLRQQAAFSPGQLVNHRFNQYRYWRYHVLNGSPDISFKLNFYSRFGTATITQAKQSTLSMFKMVKNGTVNIGYYGGALPQKISFAPSKLGYYRLVGKVHAERLGSKYRREVQQIQNHALGDVQFANNQVQGRIRTDRPGILTSSIPYSSGWQATVDGKPAKILRTNQAFVGLRLPAGSHRVKLTYHVPGLATGLRVSLIGLIWVGLAGLVTVIYRKKH